MQKQAVCDYFSFSILGTVSDGNTKYYELLKRLHFWNSFTWNVYTTKIKI